MLLAGDWAAQIERAMARHQSWLDANPLDRLHLGLFQDEEVNQGAEEWFRG